MPNPRFNQVFATLMGTAFLTSFIVPQSWLDPARVHAAGLFNPLSYPIRRLAESIYHPPSPTDPRPDNQLAAENDRLRQELARLQANVDRLQKLEAERQKLGDLQSLCVRVPVTGNDSGGRDGLTLAYTPSAGLAPDEPVLYSGGLAGRLQTAHGAARVRLITDKGFALTGSFVRFVDNAGALTPVKITAPTPLVRGLGQGRLAVVGMSLADYHAAALRAGDWVILDDPQWPKAVQGVRLGRVTSAQLVRDAPLFVSITLTPEADLNRLADVWVLAKN